MNVSEMVKNVNAECHPVTNVNAFIKRALNRGQKVVASKHKFSWTRQYRYTLSTADGTEFYALSPLVDTSKLILFYNPTNTQFFSGMTELEFRRFEPNPGEGSPYLYRLMGFSPVAVNPPSAGSVIDLVSDSAADTTQTVTLAGLDTNAVYQTEEASLNGLTSVPSTKSYANRMFILSKDATTTGTVTASYTSGATTYTMARIAPRERHISHPIVGLFNIPDAVHTLYYDFYMKLPDISDDEDASIIPEQYHDVIELYAKFQLFKHLNNPSMAQLVAAEFASRIEDMKADDKQPVGVFAMNSYRPGQVEIARLPAMFPNKG